jgi:hypothetical protein
VHLRPPDRQAATPPPANSLSAVRVRGRLTGYLRAAGRGEGCRRSAAQCLGPMTGRPAADRARFARLHDRRRQKTLPTPAAVHVVRVDPHRLVHAPHPHLPTLRRRLLLRSLFPDKRSDCWVSRRYTTRDATQYLLSLLFPVLSYLIYQSYLILFSLRRLRPG